MLSQHIKTGLIKQEEHDRGSLYLVAATNVRQYPNIMDLSRQLDIHYPWLVALKNGESKNSDVTKIQKIVEFFIGNEL